MSGKSFLAVMAVLGVVALLGFGVINKSGKALDVGDEVPISELPLLGLGTVDGSATTGSLSDFRGTWVLMNIWASWCGPCETESPDLVDFQREHSSKSFTILGVQTQDGTEDGLDFVKEFGLNYPSLRDGSGDYADDLGSTGVPETILVDPDGKLAYVRRGEVDAELLEAEVLPLITAATVPPEES